MMDIYETYREAEILTADPIRLTELLYRGALDATREARRFLLAGEIEARGRAVSKAGAILLELAASLDHERGGEFSRNLAGLYGYMLGRLTEAHVDQREEPLAEVDKLLGTLLDAWSTLNMTPEPAMPADLYGSFEAEAERVSCVA